MLPAFEEPVGMRMAQGGLIYLQLLKEGAGFLELTRIAPQQRIDEAALRTTAEFTG